ncbi:hypothetical protein, partial [Chitiniphilus shinanonensis]
MKYLIPFGLILLLAGCGTVGTVVSVGAATVGAASAAVNVAATTAGVAWDVGKATVQGGTAVAGWAVDAAKSAPPAAPPTG